MDVMPSEEGLEDISRNLQRQRAAPSSPCPYHASTSGCAPVCMLSRRRALLVTVHSPGSSVCTLPANRTQLQQAFYDHYIPREFEVSGRTNPFQWIIHTAQAGTSPALSSAVNTVSALVLNRATLDMRFLQAAVLSYAKAVSLARREMANTLPKRSLLIATAHTLALCELFYRLSLDETKARPHSRLILHLTQTEAIRAGSDDPVMPIMTGYGIRIMAMWELLVTRKNPLPDLAIDPNAHDAGRPDDLVNLGIHTAGVIEKGDALLQSGSRPRLEFLQYLDTVVRVKGMLHEWMTGRSRQSLRPLYWLVATDRHPFPFPSVRGTSSLFSFLHEFPSLFIGNLHITYWMCLLVLTEMQILIIDAAPQHFDFGTKEYLSLKKAMNEYADNICMSILFIARAEHGWGGRMSTIRPLHLLCQHFVRTANWRKLAWCVHCAEDLGCIRAAEGCRAPRVRDRAVDLTKSKWSNPQCNLP